MWQQIISRLFISNFFQIIWTSVRGANYSQGQTSFLDKFWFGPLNTRPFRHFLSCCNNFFLFGLLGSVMYNPTITNSVLPTVSQKNSLFHLLLSTSKKNKNNFYFWKPAKHVQGKTSFLENFSYGYRFIQSNVNSKPSIIYNFFS